MPEIKITGGCNKLPDKEIRAFKKFRNAFYRGDALYIATGEFVTDMLLNKTTRFAKSLETLIIYAVEKGERIAQCLLTVAPNTDFAQLAFFDCPRNSYGVADEMIETAIKEMRKRGIKRLVAGLSGHLSYGVGILNETTLKNSFDTNYNKTYTGEFFKNFETVNTLSAYRCKLSDARERLNAVKFSTNGFSVRESDFSEFKSECEILRTLCDRTIGTTYLYTPTAEGHFYGLLKDLKLLLTEKNLLFLMHDGKEVGFVLWHPDFNCAVKSGRPLTKTAFVLNCIFNKRKIDTVKLNAIGVLKDYKGRGTLALLRALEERTRSYEYIETNFVWDNNVESTLINKRLLGQSCRKFSVYEKEI